jgi:hypothetical protein
LTSWSRHLLLARVGQDFVERVEVVGGAEVGLDRLETSTSSACAALSSSVSANGSLVKVSESKADVRTSTGSSDWVSSTSCSPMIVFASSGLSLMKVVDCTWASNRSSTRSGCSSRNSVRTMS